MAKTNNNSTNSENKIILGIDEVGRGPWAGPLVVGAVVLKTRESTNPPTWQDSLADSKQLTPSKRKTLSAEILAGAAATALGWVSSQELDEYGLSASLRLATRRAVKQILATKTYFDEIVIDGTVNFLQNTPLADRVTVLPKADALIREVSAASIIAKHARDEYMKRLSQQYPFYGFETNSGYGTKKHQEALELHGITPEHRRSFRPVREYLESHQLAPDSGQTEREQYHNTTMLGHIAEIAVTSHLQAALGHQIIAQNWHTKFCEIDIISRDLDNIYFTEVKYSSNTDTEGTPLARINHDKRLRMERAAESYLQNNPDCAELTPHLAVASVTNHGNHVAEWFALTE